ncbi:MAG: DUF2341 domain-containing protein [Candidatus Thorarchaeota archaeon]
MKKISEISMKKRTLSVLLRNRQRFRNAIVAILISALLVGPAVAFAPPPDPEPPRPPTYTYSVHGTVRDAITGFGVQGATVTIYCYGDYLETTSTGGSGVFLEPVASDYRIYNFRIVITKSGYFGGEETAGVSGIECDFGDVYITPNVKPVLGVPFAERNNPYEATVTVDVTWQHEPYISRAVWVEWDSNSVAMQSDSGGYVGSMTGLDPSEPYDYQIRATEVWPDPMGGPDRVSTSISTTYSVVSWPAPNLAQWDYMQWHQMYGSPGAGTDYPVRIIVHYGDGFEGGEHVYANGDCGWHFEDIRFTTGDGKAELPYWREFYDPGNYAIFWVRMYENLDEDITFRMYYGRSYVPTTSSGHDTFLFFDDFDDEKETYTWTNIATGSGSATNAYQNGELHFDLEATSNGAAYGYDLWSDKTWSTTSFAMYANARWTGLDDYRGYASFLLPGFLDNDNHYTSWLYQIYGDHKFRTACVVDSGAIYTNNPSDSGDSEGSMEIYYYINGNYYDLTVDGEYDEQKTGTSATDLNAPFRVRLYSAIQSRPYYPNSMYDTYVDTFFDTVYVRKWIPNEPTHGEWYRDVLIDDCSSESGWDNKTDFADWRYPIDDPTDGSLVVGNHNGVSYLDCVNIPSPSEQKHEGPTFVKEFPIPFRLSSLSMLEIDLRRPTVHEEEKGRLTVTLYDDHTASEGGSKPILYIRLEDTSTTSTRMKVVAGYYDENLNRFVDDDNFGSFYDPGWSDTFRIWFDQDTGLWIDHDSGSPVQHLDWTGLNPSRMVSYIGIQWTKYYQEPMPEFRVYGIRINSYEGMDQVDFRKATGLRSGPKDALIQRPGPYNEVQFFPQDGDGKLKFRFTGYGNSPILGKLTLDIRRIRLYDSSSTPGIRVWWNGEQLPTHDLLESPFQSYNTVNYLHEWDVTIQPTTQNIVEIDVRGGDWNPLDLVALRGVWMSCLGIYNPPSQVFADSGELTYYVPLGPDTKLDLDWSGSSPLDVWIDGELEITQTAPANDIAIGDFARNSLHEIRIVYPGSNPSDYSFSVMHFHHKWMNIEIDWIEPYDPRNWLLRTPVNFLGFEAWWRANTHGRIDCLVSDTGVPPSNLNTSTTIFDYFPEEVAEIGLTHFSHLGERDWLWTLIVPFAWNHKESQDDIVGGYQSVLNFGNPNGWKRGIYTAVGWNWELGEMSTPMMESIMQHEWGHASHVHEGYPDKPEAGEPCGTWSCVFNNYHLSGLTAWWGIELCEFHWRQTWMSIKLLDSNGQWTGDLRGYSWAFDWWLL